MTWSGSAQPHRPVWDHEGFGPFVFSRTEHDTALRDLVDRVGTSPA